MATQGKWTEFDVTVSSIVKELVAPGRIKALLACDTNVLSYDTRSFLMVVRFKGRNTTMIWKPLMFLLLWSLLIKGVFMYRSDVAERIVASEVIALPLLTPLSFLLVFRLGRAAVRYWDARAAAGKMVETCRTFASTAIVACKQRDVDLNGDIARWTCILPIAVKNFLRPIPGGGCQRKDEIGGLLSETERQQFLDAKGDVFAPILVLNKLRELAFKISLGNGEKYEVIYRQLNEQIDILTGTWGALERINGTPLPFVYVVHLRSLLLLYLCFLHLEAVASEGWIAIAPVMLISWGLLGVEAAAVECESPFQWRSNHLKLGNFCVVVSKNVAQTLHEVGLQNYQRSTFTDSTEFSA